MQLSKCRVLITGAAGGIGRAVAAELVRNGARVLLVDRDARALSRVANELSSAIDGVRPQVCDLTSAEDRTRLCEVASEWSGGINVLINNAGLNPFGLYEDLTAAPVDAALDINLHAPMHLCRQLLPHLRRQAP